MSPTLAPSAPVLNEPLDCERECERAFAELRSALTSVLDDPVSVDRWADLVRTRRAASIALSHLPRGQQQSLLTSEARALVREMTASGVHDVATEHEDLELAQSFSTAGWAGQLAAMLLVPAWQWSQAPALEAVPDWLWSDYTGWLFAAPANFTVPGQAEIYAAHILRRLEELLRWAERNRGSAAVRAALAAYTQLAPDALLPLSSGNLRRHAELRGKLLQSATGRTGDRFERSPQPRSGRRLRVGFVLNELGAASETYRAIPLFEHLDPDRFEIILFTCCTTGMPVERYCRQRAREFYGLPEKRTEQLSTLRAAGLDILVFASNLSGSFNAVTQLALARIAPLQVATSVCRITSGLPEIDLFVSGHALTNVSEAGQFTERLGLLPGPGFAFNGDSDQDAPSTTWTREALSLPTNAIVFVSAAGYLKITPEVQQVWARLLASIPGSYLLLHPFHPGASHPPVARFCAEFDRVLAAQGIDNSRLVVSTELLPARRDVSALLSVGDIYLDTHPLASAQSIVMPLELGLPAVVWESDALRSRSGAALLRTLGCDELVARSAAEYHRIVMQLAADEPARKKIGARVRSAMERIPVFLDSLAMSDAFGELLETAYDELVESGHSAFRAHAVPVQATGSACVENDLQAATNALAALQYDEVISRTRAVLRTSPAHTTARHLLGKALLATGQPGRAGDYLLGAVQTSEGDATLWFDLATALHQNGQTQQALEALEASLRLDQKCLAAWLMMAELAQAGGSTDIAREALEIASQLSPDNPDIAAKIEQLSPREVATIATLAQSRVEVSGPVEVPPALAAQMKNRPLCDLTGFLNDIRVRGFRPRGIVDVGANYGNWTRVALSIFPSTPVLMIEPQEEMKQHLQPLADKMGIPYVQAGAGREPGELVQTIWEDLAGSSFLPAVNDQMLKTGKQRRTPIVTIDQLLAGTYRDLHPDLVKLDIQGFELEALRGATTLFGRTEVFIVETSLFPFNEGQPTTFDIISFMAANGYEIYDITEHLRRPCDGALGQMDVAFVKRDGMFRRKPYRWA